MLDQQEPVQDPQIDEVEAEVQDAKSSDMPLWVWIVGGVVAIAAIVLIICGAKGVFSADSDADKLANVQAEEIKRNDQTQTSVDESQQRPEGVVASKPLETETTVKDTVGTEATESGWSPLSKLLGLGLTGTATAWYSGWFSSADKQDDEEPAVINGEGPLVNGEDPLVNGGDSSGSSTTWTSNLLTMATEHPYVSCTLGAIALVGGYFALDRFCSSKGGKLAHDKKDFSFAPGMKVTAREQQPAVGTPAVPNAGQVGPLKAFEGEATILSGIQTYPHDHEHHAYKTYVMVELPVGSDQTSTQPQQIEVLLSDLVQSTQTAGEDSDSESGEDPVKAVTAAGGAPTDGQDSNTPTTSGDAQATQQFSFGPQNSIHSTHSQQSGGDPSHPTSIAGAAITLVDTNNSNHGEGKAPATPRVSTGLSSGSIHSAGDRITAFTAPPPYAGQDSLSHPSRRVSGGQPIATGLLPEDGVEGPPGRVNTAFGPGGRLSVVSPISGALTLDSVDLQDGDDSAPQAAEGSVVRRGDTYYQVANDRTSLTLIEVPGAIQRRREGAVEPLNRRDMAHILEVGQVRDDSQNVYTFAGKPVVATAGESKKGGCCSAAVADPPTYRVWVTPVAEEHSISMTRVAGTDGQDQGQGQEIEINLAHLQW